VATAPLNWAQVLVNGKEILGVPRTKRALRMGSGSAQMVPLKNQANRPINNKFKVVTASARLKHRCQFDPWFNMRATAARVGEILGRGSVPIRRSF